MKNVICGHFLLKTRGNGLDGGVQRIQNGYFAVFRLALDERKILVGVVDSIPPARGRREFESLTGVKWEACMHFLISPVGATGDCLEPQ